LKKSDIVIPEDEESSSDDGDDEDSDDGTEEDSDNDESEIDEDTVGEVSHIVLASPLNESEEQNGNEQGVGTPDELSLMKAAISEVSQGFFLMDLLMFFLQSDYGFQR